MMWQLNILGWVGLCHKLDFGVENQIRIMKWGEICIFPFFYHGWILDFSYPFYSRLVKSGFYFFCSKCLSVRHMLYPVHS
jgi:hypothetical protein